MTPVESRELIEWTLTSHARAFSVCADGDTIKSAEQREAIISFAHQVWMDRQKHKESEYSCLTTIRRDELEELRKDKMRLDWLDGESISEVEPHPLRWVLSFEGHNEANIRDGIDAAIERTKP